MNRNDNGDAKPNAFNSGEPGKIEGVRAVRYTTLDGQTFYRIGGDRAWRNHNPGNIMCSPFAERRGSIGCDGARAIFPNNAAGENAHKSLLKTGKYQERSVKAVVEAWAPSNSGNPTEKYIEYVRQRTGMPETTKVRDMSPAQFESLYGAMKQFEGHKPGQELTGRDAPAFQPGAFPPDEQSPRGAPSANAPAAIRSTSSGSTPAARPAHSAAGKETLEREGDRVYRVEPDGATRGSFHSE